MNKYALKKAIIIGDLTEQQGKQPPFHENGNYVVLDGVQTEQDGLLIVDSLYRHSCDMTIDLPTITGLIGTPQNRQISPLGRDTDIAYNPARQELHIYGGTVCEDALDQWACPSHGMETVAFGPYIRMANSVADLKQMKTTFDNVARVVPVDSSWHQVRGLAVNDQFLAASVRAVDGIVSRSGLQGELQRAGCENPVHVTRGSIAYAYYDRSDL